jgi:hypothetical protein
MTDFTQIRVIEQNLVTYWLGSFVYLGYLLIFMFFMFLIGKNIPINYAVVISLPLVGALSSAIFATNVVLATWLILGGFIYAGVLIVLFNQ